MCASANVRLSKPPKSRSRRIAPHRALGQPRAGREHRHVRSAQCSIQVGPQLGFEHDGDIRMDRARKRRTAAAVERQVRVFDPLAEQLRHATSTGAGRRRDDDGPVRIALEQLRAPAGRPLGPRPWRRHEPIYCGRHACEFGPSAQQRGRMLRRAPVFEQQGKRRQQSNQNRVQNAGHERRLAVGGRRFSKMEHCSGMTASPHFSQGSRGTTSLRAYWRRSGLKHSVT